VRQYHIRTIALIATLLALALPARAAKLEVGAPGWITPLVREAAALYVEETGNQVAVHPYRPTDFKSFAAQGGMDVLIGGCQDTMDEFAKGGFTVAGSAKPLTCSRASVVVAPANPKHIRGLEDLETPGLRWGLVNLDEQTQAGLLGEGEHTFAYTSSDPGVMMEWLAAGKVDAVLGWDGDYATHRLNPVVIRLPLSRYGKAAAAKTQAAVTTKTQAPTEAAALVNFLSANPRVHDLYAARGCMTDDGAGAISFEDVSANRFAKAGVYDSISRQLREDYRVTDGVAVDVGCGPGRLALALANGSQLHVIGVDIEPEAIELARKHAQEAGLAARTEFYCADAHSLPLPDNSADLLVSRATIQFLRDQALAIREAYRVLKPGGVAFIGNGLGRYLTPEQEKQMHAGWKSPQDVEKETGRSLFPFWPKSLDAVMTRSGISSYRLVHEGGDWIEIRKPAA
jgi:SAM-dependent methyltransferase